MIRHGGRFAVLLLFALVLFLGLDLLLRSFDSLSLAYFLDPPRDLGRAGGIGPLLLNTALIVGLSVALATLVSLPAAVLYTQLPADTPWRRFLHGIFDIGVGSPRIVWGLFGGVFFGGICGLGFSVATGVLTLACLLAPILTTGFIAGLEAVDPALGEQCEALGVGPLTAAWTQIVPAARPALVASLALAVGRGCGDAAALFFTAGLATRLPASLLDSASTLAVFVFNLLATVPGGQQAAYPAAAVLFALTLGVQLAVASLGRREALSR